MQSRQMNLLVDKQPIVFQRLLFLEKSILFFSQTACKDTLYSSLKDAQKGGFTASSFLGPSFEPWRAGFFDSNKYHSWCAENGTSQFLQIDLRILHKVTGISTRGVSKGIARMDAWVEEYSVQYSEQGDVWIDHRNKSSKKVF